MSGIIIDLGTGDGKLAYQKAKENPDKFVIGIDPNPKALEKVSSKIYKKTQKGGLSNALFVLANVEDLPFELKGVANEINIILPWGSLLKALAAGDTKVLKNISQLAAEDATIEIVMGYNLDREADKIQSLDLPSLSLDYINQTLLPLYEEAGIEITDTKQLTPEDLKTLNTTWSKKLSFGQDRPFFYIKGKIK